jgi:hypothetical protein
MTHKVIGMWPTTEFYFRKKTVYKRLRRQENRLRNDCKTSNDGDASTKTFKLC